MRKLTLALLPLVALSIAAPASAGDELRRVPDSAVQLSIVSRDDTSFTVEVTNPSDGVARFDAIGLYFVPDSNGDEQRLGVVTAGRVARPDGTWANATDVVDVAAHASITLKLTSYCIDAKRQGPPVTAAYHLASRRMPTALTTALAGIARTVASLGYDPESARGVETQRDAVRGASYAVTQAAIWRVRAQMPTLLMGENHVTK